MFESFYNNPGWTYNEAFAWMFAGQALVWSAVALSVSILFYFISYLIKRKDEGQGQAQNYQAIDNENVVAEGSYQGDHREQTQANQDSERKAITIKVFDILGLLASWYALLAAAIFPSVLSGLGIIPVWASMLITLFIFSIKFAFMIYYYSPAFLNKNDRPEQHWCPRLSRRIGITMSSNKLAFGVFITFAFAYTITVPLITADTCLDFYNYGYGEKFYDFGLSTRFSRYFQIETACPQGKICQLYATLPEDAATAVILNVHTGTDIKSITIGYEELKKLDQDKIKNGIHQELPKKRVSKSFYIDLETRGVRYMHSVFLSGLTPNTQYYLEVYYGEETDKAQASTTYLTLPSDKLERNILLAAGGDAGTTLMARQMTASLGNYSIDAIIVGGDLAYDNGIRSCYYSFDLFFNMFKPVNEKLGRLVPFITSIGNHDIGFNAFQNGKVDITQNLYMTYFPLQSKYDNEGKILNEVPDLHERLSYNYHLLGNTVQLCLDSGYLSMYDGAQKEFIEKISKDHHDRLKMANFHVPMFPTCFNPLYDDVRTIDHPREHWAPLFQKHKFASIFENHVHLYKISFPLDDKGKHSPEGGVMYFGDGNWGINPDPCYPRQANGNETGLLQTYDDTTHVWLISINQDTISHFAVNVTGHMFDKPYDLKTKDYKLNYDL